MDDQTAVMTTSDYLARLAGQRSAIEAGPWDLRRRRVDFAQLLKRLGGERDALLACIAERPVPAIHLFITDGDKQMAQQTRDSWLHQSHPGARLIASTAEVAHADQADDLILVARPGDLFHPGMATALALRDLSTPHQPLAWTWNSVTGRGKQAVPIRKPGRAPLTLLGANYVGRAIAFRVKTALAAPVDSLGAFVAGDASLLLLLVAAQTPIDWAHHPEKLSAATTDSLPASYWGRNATDSSGLDPHADARLAALNGLALSLGEGQWRKTSATGNTRPPVEPASVLSGVSVVIPFRDHVEETIKAVRAVSVQRSLPAIEVVLVNNGSQPQLLAELKTGLQTFTESMQVRFVDYPFGFSHSRQCNLGVEQAIHDTVVVLNNDAYLQGRDVLSELVRWAGVPGVATVGARIVNDAGQLVCGGLRARVRGGLDFESSVEESRDRLLCEGLREVFGNTGACFAIRRDRFLALGGFDGVNFPIGLNDVDFCLRAIRSGLTHINLGWLTICHKPGTSRGASDELYQRLLLRERYPEVTRLAQFQLGIDDQPHEDWSSIGRIERLVISVLRWLRAGLGK